MSDPIADGQLTIRAVGDIGGDFFVPAYQRGYRWGEHEVLQLLTDIRDSDGATYYLQPIVVKRRTDDSWELVDGQQRLTTLYLVFQYLERTHLRGAAPKYSITYETREGSKEYLDRLAEAEADKNIDFFHIFRAYRCIESWFESFGHRATHEATRFYGYLFEGVKVLWYVAPKEQNSTELFTRLNVGRIPLTDAELVKALLLSRNEGTPGQTNRAIEIATHWDGFERDLRSPEMWAFVTHEAENRPTNMSLLFDTLAGEPQGQERTSFYTFERLRQEIIDSPQAFWEKVVELHSLVLGWFEDRNLYHKVGYLIACGFTFQELYALSKDKGRSEFEATLHEEIRRKLKLPVASVADLTYNGTSAKAREVLLLMNVETIRKTKDARYSFSAQATGEWSLEHIHAQNTEPLNTAEQWSAWLKEHRDALNALKELPGVDGGLRAHLLARLDQALSTTVTKQIFRALEQEIVPLFSPNDEQLDNDTHSISNLALLGQRDNSALNNSVFEVKRRRIIALDKEGSYVPVCTRNVFLKYYTEEDTQQPHFWSNADREAYGAAIRDQIAPYLLSDEAES